MRRTIQSGIDLIKRFEGFSHMPYLCSGGYRTIGYGHKICENEDLKFVSEDDAEKILINDLRRTEQGVVRLVRNDINDSQFAALVSFSFNLGVGTLQRSTLRQKINFSSSDEEIRGEFMKWVKVRGRVFLGLVRRRIVESELFFL
jgi:lysozyme